MNRHEISFLASSSTDRGATNVSANGDRFTVQLDTPIEIPHEAKNITVSMEQATIWYVTPNIITGTNDIIEITDTGADSGTAGVFTLTIPQGLYDLSGLNQAIQTQLLNGGAAVTPSHLITLSGDSATQKVIITANYIGISIDFTIAQTFREILGFDSQVLGPSVAVVAWTADNVAAFNTVNYFLIHSDIVSSGIRFNNTYSQVLDQVLIDKSPGSQLVHSPLRPPRIAEPNLSGAMRSALRFWLTDDQDRSVNTNSETWSLRFVVRYDIPA